MATPDQPVRHHHVPVFYLRKWANTAGRIVVTRKTEGRLHRSDARPDSIGFQKNLFALESPAWGDKQKLERDVFGPLDTAAAPVLQKMIGMQGRLSEQERGTWASFLQSLHIRVPQHVDLIRSTAPAFLENLLGAPDPRFERIKGHDPARNAAEYLRREAPHVLQDAGVRIIAQLVGETKAHRAMREMHWCWRELESSTPLLTSDVPFLVLGGLYDPTCMLTLPLSPRHAFFASRQRNAIDDALNASAGPLARAINDQIVEGARRFVVGECKERFVAIRWGLAPRR
jgi:hypothetical protein